MTRNILNVPTGDTSCRIFLDQLVMKSRVLLKRWKKWDGSELSGMMPTLFADNPAAAEVAFHSDPGNGRRDVDRLNRSLFQAEVVDGEEAIQICRKPRAGEAVYVFKQANMEALQNPPRPSAQAEPQPSGSGTTHLQSGAPAGPQPSGSGSQPAQKKPRLEQCFGSVFIFYGSGSGSRG
jgi:hypothetical protein